MTAHRWKFRDSAQTYVGATLPIVRIPNATVTVFLAGTTTAYGGTIWRNATGLTGGDQYANPFTTDASGAIEFFLDDGIPVKVQVTKPSDPTVGTLTVDYEPMVPDPRDIVTSGKGGIVYLMDYAGGLAIDGGTVDGTFAITAAVAAAAATGAKIVVPPGTFIGTWLPTDNLHVEGAGPKTILKRPNNTHVAIWDPRPKVGTKLSNVTLDGNWTNNHAHAGALALVPEAYSGGTDNSFEDVAVQNWNWFAFQCAGVRTVWTRCGGKGRTPATYEPDVGGSLTTNYDSWGVFGSISNDYCLDMTLTDCWAESTRVNGFAIGGISTTIVNPHIRNTHRGESNATGTQTVGTWTGIGSGGGQIGTPLTASAPGNNGDQPPINLAIVAPQIGFSDGAKVTGIEMNGAVDCSIVAPQISYQSGGSITIVSCTRVGVRGGILRHAGVAELSVADSDGCSWDGVAFFDHVKGVVVSGTTDNWRSAGCYFKTTIGGGTHFTNGSGTHYDNGPHRIDNSVINGGAVPTELMRHQTNGPAVLIRNTNVGGSGATSDGIEIRAGSTAFDAAWTVYTYNRGTVLAQLVGSGAFSLPTLGARFMGDLSNATLTNRLLAQTITPNSPSSFGVVPSGSGTQADLTAYANASPASAAVAAILRATATEAQLRADSPAGSYQPLGIYTNNTAAMRITVAHDLLLGGGSGAKTTSDTSGYLWVPYSLGKPTGNPGTPTGSAGLTAIQADLTNNKLCMWTGAAWISTAALT